MFESIQLLSHHDYANMQLNWFLRELTERCIGAGRWCTNCAWRDATVDQVSCLSTILLSNCYFELQFANTFYPQVGLWRCSHKNILCIRVVLSESTFQFALFVWNLSSAPNISDSGRWSFHESVEWKANDSGVVCGCCCEMLLQTQGESRFAIHTNVVQQLLQKHSSYHSLSVSICER